MREKIGQIIISRAPSWAARLTVTLVMGAILIAVTVLCSPLRFKSNDDLAMMRIAAFIPNVSGILAKL